MKKENYPAVEFLKEFWNEEKNGISLIDAKIENKYKYWWFCQEFNHSFKKDIRFMQRDQRCLVCKGIQLLPGFNDFETLNKDYLDEWDYEKNTVSPNKTYYRTTKSIFWECVLAHSYTATAFDKMRNRGGCPYCKNIRVLKGFNDLSFKNPELLVEWNYDLNDKFPDETTYCSGIKVHWVCQKDNRHKWEEKPFNRTNKARNWGCPYCAGKRVISGVNDLATTHSHLLDEWDYKKNTEIGLNPINLTYGSSKKKAYWLCKKFKHSWKVTISERTKYGCPVCANLKILPGYNDFASQTSQKLLNEWDYEKNNFKPDSIALYSEKTAWWICPLNHSYDMPISSRTGMNYNCSICSNFRILKGFNDLNFKFPKIAKQWHPEKNGELKPDQVGAGSGRKVWWKCQKGHEWKATIVKRTGMGRGCRWCSLSGSSGMERSLRDYIDSICDYDLVVNSKKIIKPYELDIYIPELNLAFEFNGTYWHSDAVIFNRTGLSADEFHQMKTDMCEKLDIKLIHISESDWTESNSEVLQMISSEINNRIPSQTLKNTV